MFGYSIVKDKEIISALKQVEELRKVNAILRLKLDNPCFNFGLSSLETRELDIHRGSYLSSILSMYKELNK